MYKFCFQIHNIPGVNKVRDYHVEKNRKKLKQFSTDLNLETILIKTETDYKKFIEKNNKFKANLKSFPEGLGDVGLWASYYLALKKFIESDFDYLISLQDEVVLFYNFKKLLFKYLQKLPQDADFLYLDNLHSPVLSVYNKSYKNYEVNDTIWVSHHWFSGDSVLFTKSGANKIINFIENNTLGNYIDSVLLEFENLPTVEFEFKKNIPFIKLSGELPKTKNKKFNSYSISPYVQTLTGSFRTYSIIRETHLK